MKYPTRTIILLDQSRKDIAKAAIDAAPNGIEVKLQEPVKPRTLDQQALLFAGPLKDISEQAWVSGRTYSVEVWHHHYKNKFLPEDKDPYIFELVKHPGSYKKYDYSPRGERILIGSTTDLTKYGYSQYLEQIFADGAGMGVLFTDVKHAV